MTDYLLLKSALLTEGIRSDQKSLEGYEHNIKNRIIGFLAGILKLILM